MAFQLGQSEGARGRQGRRQRVVSPPGGTRSEPDGARARILLVEDDELVQESIGLVLESDGYAVSFAGNGFEALSRLEAEAEPVPDAIVLDLRMPVMDGWQFRIIQREHAKLGHIPVVALSADGTPQAAAISAQAYLRKPVTAQALLDTVERVLAEDRMQREASAEDTSRLAALGRLAARVGHEINNPLTVVMLSLQQARESLKPSIDALEGRARVAAAAAVPESLKAELIEVAALLADCQKNSERIEAAANRVGSTADLAGRQAEVEAGAASVDDAARSKPHPDPAAPGGSLPR